MMSGREKKLIGLVAILFLLLVGYYVLYKPLTNETAELEAEIATLNEEVSVLREEYNKLPEYKSGIKNAQEEIAIIQEGYPSNVKQENAFALIFDIENAFEELEINSASFSPLETLTYGDEDQGTGGVTAVKQVLRTNVSVGYEEVKDLLSFIYDYPDRTVLDSLSLSLGEEEQLIIMTLNMNMYAILGSDKPYELPVFDEVEKGKQYLFDAKASQSEKKAETSVQELTDPSADLFIALKPVASDIEAQVIGLSNDNVQKSYVKKDINGEIDAVLRVYSQNGQYYANYDLDGTYKEQQAFTLGNVLELDLFSAKRLDDNDKVAMNMTIINQTSEILYVNRKEEDYNNPRFKATVIEGEVEFR